MVPIGITKRKLGDVWVQLAVSSCVLLAPPLLMAAGVAYLGSSPPQSAAPAPKAASNGTDNEPNSFIQAEGGASSAAASAAQHPFITAPQPVIERPSGGAQAAVSRSISTDDAPAAVPERSPSAARGIARNDPRNGHGSKRQHAPTLSDILPFLRPGNR
jgi:hypothetical protein